MEMFRQCTRAAASAVWNGRQPESICSTPTTAQPTSSAISARCQQRGVRKVPGNHAILVPGEKPVVYADHPANTEKRAYEHCVCGHSLHIAVRRISFESDLT